MNPIVFRTLNSEILEELGFHYDKDTKRWSVPYGKAYQERIESLAYEYEALMDWIKELRSDGKGWVVDEASFFVNVSPCTVWERPSRMTEEIRGILYG